MLRLFHFIPPKKYLSIHLTIYLDPWILKLVLDYYLQEGKAWKIEQ